MIILDVNPFDTEKETIIPYDFELVRKVYPQVTSMCSQNGAWDEDGNEVELDFSLIEPLVEEHNLEIQWRYLRSKRDDLLSEVDWVTLKAYSMGAPVPEAWAEYQQALRDLPSNTTDPYNPIWPTKPQ
jgi:hypothetical protein